MNQVNIIGNLTADPETAQVGDNEVVKARIAQNRKFKKGNGEVVEKVCYIDIEAWNGRGVALRDYCTKGRQVGVTGSLAYDQWEDNDGNKRSKHKIEVDSITLIGSRHDNGDSNDDGPDI